VKAEIGAFEKDRQELWRILPLATPLLLEFHPTHICNFKCNFCIHATGKATVGGKPFKKEAMEWDLFETIVEQLKAFPNKIKIVSIAGLGEPLTHPRIADMVRRFKNSGTVKKVQIISNASLLSSGMSDKLLAAGLDNLKISLQGVSDEAYERISGVKISFDKIYDNIKHFSKKRGNTRLSVKIADTALDEGDEEKFYEIFGDICDAVAVEHIFNMWKASGVDISRYTLPSDKNCWGYAQRKILRCRQRFTAFDILPDGTFCLGGCHRRFGFEHDIREAPIIEQWNCEGANKARRDMLTGGRSGDPMCRICDYGANNWHPMDLLEGHEEEILARMGE
jgi:organic radical activating enzyme